jgi:hypothetical protein
MRRTLPSLWLDAKERELRDRAGKSVKLPQAMIGRRLTQIEARRLLSKFG